MARTRRIKCEDGNEITATFVNPGEWFKKRWLIGLGCGFECQFYIVEADSEQAAIGTLVDRQWGNIVVLRRIYAQPQRTVETKFDERR